MPEDYFDFKSVSEQEEKLDYQHLKPCPHCQKSIAQDVTICYFCGQDLGDQGKASRSGWIVVVVVVVFILSLAFAFLTK